MELANNNNGKPIAKEEMGFVEDIKQIVNNDFGTKLSSKRNCFY